MSRRKVSAASQLLDEARNIELLLDEIEPPTERIQEYWSLSLEMIALVTRMEMAVESGRQLTAADEEYRSLRRGLTHIESRIAKLDRESEVTES